ERAGVAVDGLPLAGREPRGALVGAAIVAAVAVAQLRARRLRAVAPVAGRVGAAAARVRRVAARRVVDRGAQDAGVAPARPLVPARVGPAVAQRVAGLAGLQVRVDGAAARGAEALVGGAALEGEAVVGRRREPAGALAGRAVRAELRGRLGRRARE